MTPPNDVEQKVIGTLDEFRQTYFPEHFEQLNKERQMERPSDFSVSLANNFLNNFKQEWKKSSNF